jgi:hypothetical protein
VSAAARATLPTRRTDVVVHDLADHSVLEVGDGGELHRMNPTARAIWELCDGETTIEEVTDAICRLFSLEPSVAMGDIEQVIASFEAIGLVRRVST